MLPHSGRRRWEALHLAPMAPALEARQIRMAHEGRVLLDGVSLVLERATVTTVQGASGSGKTTLLRILGQLDAPDAGEVLLDGAEVTALAPTAVRRRVALVAQAPAMFEGTVADNLATGLRLQGGSLPADEARRLLEQVGLDPAALGQDARGLSGGEKLRVAVARAMVLHPEVWLLDEPTAALDDDRAALIAGLLRGLVGAGAALLAVTHDTRLVERLAGRMLRLEGGKLGPGGLR